MSEFKVGCSPLTSRIYAGKVLKNGTWGANKKDVTNSAMNAVAQQLLQTNEKMQFTYRGERYELKVVKEDLEMAKHSGVVSYSVAQQYAEFCVRCDREKLPLINIEDYLKEL